MKYKKLTPDKMPADVTLNVELALEQLESDTATALREVFDSVYVCGKKRSLS